MEAKVFAALVKLCRGRAMSPANQAARLVLVDGKTQQEAKACTGATQSTISDAVRRWREVDQQVREAYGITEKQTARSQDQQRKREFGLGRAGAL